MIQDITYAQFAKLAQRRHWTVEPLSARFRGKIDEPREFFTQVLKASNSAAVIPYRSVIQFYTDSETVKPAAVSGHPLCACGCKQEVFDRQKWARPGCRKRVARKKATDLQISPR